LIWIGKKRKGKEKKRKEKKRKKMLDQPYNPNASGKGYEMYVRKEQSQGLTGFLVGRTLLFSLALLATVVWSITELIFSFTQVRQHSDLDGIIPISEECENIDDYFAVPLRVTDNMDAGILALYCPWNTRNSAVRILCHFVSIFTVIAIIVSVIYKKQKVGFYVTLVVGVVLVVVEAYVLVIDAADITHGKNDCQKFVDAGNSGEGKDVLACNYTPLYATVVLDIQFIMWLGNVILLSLYTLKWKLGPSM